MDNIENKDVNISINDDLLNNISSDVKKKLIDSYGNDINNYTNEQKNEITKEVIKKSIAFILNYGESSDLVSNGVFAINDFINVSKTPYSHDVDFSDDVDSVVVELIKVKNDDFPCVQKDETQKIYLPLEKLISMYKTGESEKNNEAFTSKHYGEFGRNILDLLYMEDILAILMSSEEPYTNNVLNEIEVSYRSLDDLQATYVVNDENDTPQIAGNNFSLIPFSLGKIKKLVKEKTIEKEIDGVEKEKTLDYIYYDGGKSLGRRR